MNAGSLKYYKAVLADLEKEKRDIELLIGGLKALISQKQGKRKNIAAQDLIIANPPWASNINKPEAVFAGVTSAPRMTDLCEVILRQANRPLHGKVLIEELEKAGRPATENSISGAMPQDHNKRFENLGRNVWALAEWPEAMKAPFRKTRKRRKAKDKVSRDSTDETIKVEKEAGE